jgi:hypothetical protein
VVEEVVGADVVGPAEVDVVSGTVVTTLVLGGAVVSIGSVV